MPHRCGLQCDDWRMGHPFRRRSEFNDAAPIRTYIDRARIAAQPSKSPDVDGTSILKQGLPYVHVDPQPPLG